MTDKEIEKEAKEYSQGNFYSEQGFMYGYERGSAEGRKEGYEQGKNNICKKILEELPKYLSESLYCEVVGNLRLVFKDLGVELWQ